MSRSAAEVWCHMCALYKQSHEDVKEQTTIMFGNLFTYN